MARNNKPYQIPFDQNGNMLTYGVHGYGVHGGIMWKDNYVFDAHLKFQSFIRGHSAANAVFVDLQTGLEYTMFLRDLADMLAWMTGNTICGQFTFCKRGTNYGLKHIAPDIHADRCS